MKPDNLPWFVGTNTVSSYWRIVNSKGELVAEVHTRRLASDITKAANAYPRLVAALKKISEMHGDGEPAFSRCLEIARNVLTELKED